MIFIPFKTFTKSVGGPSTFMRYLREYMVNNNYSFIDEDSDYKKADRIFFPISYNRKILDYFKSKGFPIMQRLDGVYYPSKHGVKYLWLNRHIKSQYFKYADLIIFQSLYSRTECFTMMGKIRDDKYKIIYNGADKEIFFPGEKIFNKKKISFATTGSFRNRDMIEPVVLALDEVSKNYNIELKVIGPITEEEVKKFTDREYVKCLGKMANREISEELKKSDILVHCQLNPACPNSVIEALSCGLPVVGFDTGAMKEILYFAPELLAHVSDEIFKRYKDFNYRKLTEKMEFCIENYGKYRQLFIENSSLYDMKQCCSAYMDVFSSF
jgi:glycosyltransferase involved in cell wall biosynthesis